MGRVRVQPLGTNVKTNIRFFVNNGSTNTTALNNQLLGEINIQGSTRDDDDLGTNMAAVDYYLNIVLKPGYRLFYTIGATVAAGFAITCPDAGDY